MGVQLRVERGARAGETLALRPGANTIGRGEGSQIVLADDKVSARHARIDVDDEGCLLADLGSTNGTRLNGKPLVVPTRLEPDDTIELGNTVLVFDDGQSPARRPGKRVQVVLEVDESRPLLTVAWADRQRREMVPAPAGALEADELRQLYDVLIALYRVTGLVSRSTTLDELLANVLEVVFDILPADRGSVLFATAPQAPLEPRAARCRETGDHTVEVSETIVREVLDSGRGVLTRDAAEDDRFRRADTVHLYGIRSAMCVPIRTPRQFIGVLYLDTRSASHRFTERDLDLLSAIGSEVGLAVENVRLLEQNLEGERLAAAGQAVAGLSHYIKNILQSIEACRVLIDAAIRDDDKPGLEEAWATLNQNTELISELVLNMLSYSRRPEPTYEPCSPNGVAADIAELLTLRAADRGTLLDLELDPDIPMATLDVGALHRAMLNLVNNAIDATGPGTVAIRTRWDRDGDRVEFAVADQGPGIAPERSDDIFQAFYTTKGSGGTGLGLAVSKKLVEELGGSIHVRSTPGQGATFTLSLPIHPPAARAGQPRPA